MAVQVPGERFINFTRPIADVLLALVLCAVTGMWINFWQSYSTTCSPYINSSFLIMSNEI